MVPTVTVVWHREKDLRIAVPAVSKSTTIIRTVQLFLGFSLDLVPIAEKAFQVIVLSSKVAKTLAFGIDPLHKTATCGNVFFFHPPGEKRMRLADIDRALYELWRISARIFQMICGLVFQAVWFCIAISIVLVLVHATASIYSITTTAGRDEIWLKCMLFLLIVFGDKKKLLGFGIPACNNWLATRNAKLKLFAKGVVPVTGEHLDVLLLEQGEEFFKDYPGVLNDDTRNEIRTRCSTVRDMLECRLIQLGALYNLTAIQSKHPHLPEVIADLIKGNVLSEEDASLVKQVLAAVNRGKHFGPIVFTMDDNKLILAQGKQAIRLLDKAWQIAYRSQFKILSRLEHKSA